MISFSDIFKGNLLAEFTAISAGGILSAIGLAFVLSLFIVFVYRLTYNGVSFSRNFAGCLVMISMVTALVIQVITSNVVLSLGMVGALSIVRFRTAVKEPTDTAFLFWAIAIGIICGAGYVTVSILANLVLGVLFVALYFLSSRRKSNSYLVVARFDRNCDNAGALADMPGFRMKNKTTTDDMIEVVAELQLSDADMKLLDQLQEQPGVREITVMQSVTGSIL